MHWLWCERGIERERERERMDKKTNLNANSLPRKDAWPPAHHSTDFSDWEIVKRKKDFPQDFVVDDYDDEAHDDDYDEDDYDNDKNDDAYHDCEKDEIVKWFPLYEGDAMFPARKSNVKKEMLNKIEKLKIRNSCKRDNK